LWLESFIDSKYVATGEYQVKAGSRKITDHSRVIIVSEESIVVKWNNEHEVFDNNKISRCAACDPCDPCDEEGNTPLNRERIVALQMITHSMRNQNHIHHTRHIEVTIS
jgi:hypothetical protein